MFKMLKISFLLGFTLFSTVYAQQYYSWSSLGNGANGTVYSITSYQNKIIIAGGFTRAGNVAAKNIAMWNDTGWVPLSTGIGTSNSDTVYALAQFNGNLYSA